MNVRNSVRVKEIAISSSKYLEILRAKIVSFQTWRFLLIQPVNNINSQRTRIYITHKHIKHRMQQVYYQLAWEPSMARVLIVNPALGRKLRFLPFFQLNLDFQTKLRTFPWFSRVSQLQVWGKSVLSSWVMIGQRNRQTEITTLYI